MSEWSFEYTTRNSTFSPKGPFLTKYVLCIDSKVSSSEIKYGDVLLSVPRDLNTVLDTLHRVVINNFLMNIIESVDCLCRDDADVQYMPTKRASVNGTYEQIK